MTLELKGLLAGIAAGLLALGAAFGVAAVGRSVTLGVARPAPQTSVAPPAARSTGTSPALIAAGAALYQRSCASCHGAHGEGVDAPSLRRIGLSDQQLSGTIQNGLSGGMPAFRSQFRPSDISAVIAYVHTLK